jgi:two-component system response regulator (stage 0 sporulation protein A)
MPAPRDGHPIGVIVCDDVPELRSILRDVLGEDQALAILGEAENGRDCLRLVAERQPDVVLLDLCMPDMHGLEVIPKLLRAAPRAAVIVFSALGRDHVGDAALAVGAHCYIEKGTPLHELATVIQEVAGAKR